MNDYVGFILSFLMGTAYGQWAVWRKLKANLDDYRSIEGKYKLVPHLWFWLQYQRRGNESEEQYHKCVKDIV